MIKLAPALLHHVERINPKELYGDPVYQRENARMAVKEGRAISIFFGNELLAIVGYIELHPGVGEVWALISDGCRKYPVTFGRRTKELLETFCGVNKLKRVQITVRKGYEEAFNFAIFLGFEPEGVLRKYGPEGDDYYMMGRVF